MADYVIRGAAIVSVDPEVGNLSRGDILVKGDRIAAIGPDLAVEDAEVIEADRMIAIPGLVNAHNHLWQTVIRGIGSNFGGADYYNYLHAGAAPRYTPDDLLWSETAGGYSMIDAGTTTVFDWCHNNPTPEHSDAAIDGLMASGVRALFGHGTVKPKPKPGEPHFSEIPHPREHIERLRKGRLASDDALVTLAMCVLGPDYSTIDVCRKDFALAKELGLISSAHVWGRRNRLNPGGYLDLAKEGLLPERHNVVHANYISDEEIRLLVESGGTITATPPVELRGHGVPPLVGRVAAQGGRPSVANDSEVGVGGDMFSTLRISLQADRFYRNVQTQRELEEGTNPEAAAFEAENLKTIGTGGGVYQKEKITTGEALKWATLNNAAVMGMEDKIGSLTVGKKADIVLLRRDDWNMTPALNPENAVAMFAHPGNVDTVLIDGEIRKRGGRLVDASGAAKALAEIRERGPRLMADAGYPDIAW
ncbi:amidohydrolase family protein [Pseudooceanicola nanhaiensis]|uniref:amidohydrolase family protein n=1 Tax=Pseudooceanicola nanhaiensis TaxID=375761 RepID=UPI001CD31631|nr:amidohydrolase family protein [Pseudooceanicola nanhaiensis]MCA0922944.1 amidohydrolase family protein [Pseudooceanicola nanhaiensis]